MFGRSTEPVRRTPRQWVDYLKSEEQPVTLEEFAAGCLSRILGCLVESTQALQHVEGMVGAVDDLLGKTHPEYASSGGERAALAEQRAQGLTERRAALAPHESLNGVSHDPV